MLKNSFFAALLVVAFAFTTQSANAEVIEENLSSVVLENFNVEKSDVAISDVSIQTCALSNKLKISEKTQSNQEPTGSYDIANLACGWKPIPPMGCTIGRCVCDRNRQNCYWETICR